MPCVPSARLLAFCCQARRNGGANKSLGLGPGAWGLIQSRVRGMFVLVSAHKAWGYARSIL